MKVLSIAARKMRRQRDVITDTDCEALLCAQTSAWRANQQAERMTKEFEARLKRGAEFESGDYYWDAELRLIRASAVVRREPADV